MEYGVSQRTFPRINVKRGFAGNEPQSITLRATPAVGEAIKSGMLIVQNGSGQWVKSSSSDTKNTVPYFAFADQTDTDVVASGQLLGLSCLGEFEIQTGYCVTASTYHVGDAVVKSATAGTVDVGASHLTAIEEVGVVSGGAKQDIAATNSEATPDGSGHVYVLNLVTRWKPAGA